MFYSTEKSAFITRFNMMPTTKGLLNNLTFAVKDVIDIQGERTSCGNPTWLSQQLVSNENATCVDRLLENGARCIGKTVLGEFNSGSAGVNHFFGMPKNPNAPDRVPGGSSSGSASVVAQNLVDFSLGTDAAGSVRLPASFCGIYGMRPSHGIISMAGVKSFSPSFDTIGIFSRTVDILEKVFQILAESNVETKVNSVKHFYIIEDYIKLIDQKQRDFYLKFVEECSDALQVEPTFITLKNIHPNSYDSENGISAIFKNILCSEIWENIGLWAKTNLEFSKTTYVDFSNMEHIDKMTLSESLKWREIYSDKLNSLLGSDNLLCIPTSPIIAPLRNQEFKKVNEFDYDKLRPLVALSGIGKLPQINMPIEAHGLPTIGLSLLSGHQQDQFLISNLKKIITCQKNIR